jgi:hypothetical protein
MLNEVIRETVMPALKEGIKIGITVTPTLLIFAGASCAVAFVAQRFNDKRDSQRKLNEWLSKKHSAVTAA